MNWQQKQCSWRMKQCLSGTRRRARDLKVLLLLAILKFQANFPCKRRRARLQQLKNRTECRKCGQRGHWSGDPQCPKSSKGSSKGKSSGSSSTSKSFGKKAGKGQSGEKIGACGIWCLLCNNVRSLSDSLDENGACCNDAHIQATYTSLMTQLAIGLASDPNTEKAKRGGIGKQVL